EAGFLAPWPVEALPGAGGRVRDRLQRLNVHRVGEVAAMPLAVLCGLFGERGRVLRDQARGVDPRPVQPTRPQQSVGRRTSFDPAPLSAPDRQGRLFPEEAADKARRLAACKDAVRERFGFMALVSGTTLTLAGRIEHDRDNFRLRTPCLTR